MKDETILEITEKMELAITTMSDKIGVGADKFYPIIVEQQYINGWVHIWLAVPILIIATVLILMGFIERKDNPESSNWAFFIGVIFYGLFIAIFGGNLTHILNPEYYAFMEIANLIK